ncbi:MAG TPA: choice-of-anchor D domain-containing protein, partial [Candidatus Acidoferrum sp.]|nr:choice-of-anchor D domain-containing protein [Candidatus Acidoferrum sp.]
PDPLTRTTFPKISPQFLSPVPKYRFGLCKPCPTTVLGTGCQYACRNSNLKFPNLRGFATLVFSRRSNFQFLGSVAAASLVLFQALILVGCASVTPRSSPSTSALSLSATSFNFSTVAIGQSTTQTLHITNTGAAPLTIHSLTLSSTQFSFTGPSLPRTVLPAQNVAYTISFVPTTAGSATAAIQIASSVSSASVSLAGVGEKAGAAVQVTPSSISFGNLQLQSTATQNVTLKNTGDINITISGVTVAGAGFGFSSLSPGYSLSPNQSVTFQVWFRPQTSGSAAGNVSILSSNLASPASISVSGAGVNSSSSPSPSLHSVTLTWGPSASSIIGYRVYRDDGSGLSPLSAVLNNLTYTDSSVVSGSTYEYAVTAVDSAGGESAYSNQVTAVIPTP